MLAGQWRGGIENFQMAAQRRIRLGDVLKDAFRCLLLEFQIFLFAMIGAVERAAALGNGIFQKHRAESGERRPTIDGIVGSDDSCAVVRGVREEHLVDVAVAHEECEFVVQLKAVVETAADSEETTSRLKIFDAPFDARRQEGIWEKRHEGVRADGEENIVDLQAGFIRKNCGRASWRCLAEFQFLNGRGGFDFDAVFGEFAFEAA